MFESRKNLESEAKSLFTPRTFHLFYRAAPRLSLRCRYCDLKMKPSIPIRLARGSIAGRTAPSFVIGAVDDAVKAEANTHSSLICIRA
jgi:hypothetical protein